MPTTKISAKVVVLTTVSAMALFLGATAVSAQDAAPAPQTSAAPTGGSDDSTTVVVTGMRKSLQSARNIKKNSDQIVDAVVAEDIGKLPDTTVSDSLARVTGVQVVRGGGEAGQILIRGLPNIATSYNGRDIFTAEARYVATQDFASGVISALEVYKSTTSDQVEGGIAGLINVRSRRPFDFKGPQVSGELRYTYATQSGNYDPNGNILLSNRWDTGAGEMGALINISYTRLRYLDSARWVGGYIGFMDGNRTPDPATYNGARYGDFVGEFIGQGDRQRPSMNAAFQWRPNQNLELYSDFLYQGFDNKVSDRQLAVPLYGDSHFTDLTMKPGADQIASLTVSNQVRPELFQGATQNNTDTYQFAVGGTWTSGQWKVSSDLAATQSKYNSSIYSWDSAFAYAPTVHVTYDVPQDDHGVSFNFVNFDQKDPNNLVYRGFYDRHLVARGRDIQFRTDASYTMTGDFLRKLDFGYRYVDRRAAFDNGDRYSYQEPLGIHLQDTGLDIETTQAGFHGSSVEPVVSWAGPTFESLRSHITQLRDRAGFPQGEPPFNPAQHFAADEKSNAAYAQIHYGFGTSIPIDGVVGVRVVKTQEHINGFAFVGPAVNPLTRDTDYTDVLPSFSLRAKLTDTLQLRLAANKTRTRADFNQLNPTLFIPPEADETGYKNGSGGNIDLKPYTSSNYDVTLEDYFSSTGFASIDVFSRKVEGFIEYKSEIIDDPQYGQLRLSQPVNTDPLTIKGVEGSVTTFFDQSFMPDWASSFGIQVNATYTDSGLIAGNVMPGISKWAYNINGMYENGPFSARIAYNYRSKWLNFLCEGGGNPGCEYTKPVARLDASANWNVNDHVTLNLDVSNALHTPYRSYRIYSNGSGGYMPRDVRYEETIYSLAFRFRY